MSYNPYNKYLKKYQESNVNTSDSKKIMIILFDACIQFLQKAITSIDEKKLIDKTENINRAKRILREFMRTIDLENGNNASKLLFVFYNRQVNILSRASVTRDKNLISKVIKDLTAIKVTFEEAIRIVNKDISKTEMEVERLEYEAKLAESDPQTNDYEV